MLKQQIMGLILLFPLFGLAQEYADWQFSVYQICQSETNCNSLTDPSTGSELSVLQASPGIVFSDKHLAKIDIELDNSKETIYRLQFSKLAFKELPSLASPGLRFFAVLGEKLGVEFTPESDPNRPYYRWRLQKNDLRLDPQAMAQLDRWSKKTRYTLAKQQRFERISLAMLLTSLLFGLALWWRMRTRTDS